jgi:hypothetical protein
MSQTLDPACPDTDLDLDLDALTADAPGKAEPGATPPSEGTDDGCPNCQAPAPPKSSFCKFCGYYALLGKCVELAEWERDYENGEYIGPKEEPKKALLFGIPAWMWGLSALLLGLAGAIIAARLFTPDDSPSRTVSSFSFAGGGLLAVIAAHVWIARMTLARNKSLELTDVVMSPLRLWIDALMDPAQSYRWVSLGAAGIWSILLAHVFLGVPYGKIIKFTSDPAPPRVVKKGEAKPKPARGSGEAKTMEEAMEEFAAASGADQLAGAETITETVIEETPPPTVLKIINCVILGFVPVQGRGDAMESLVLAEPANSQWRVLGTVSMGLTGSLQRQLLEFAPLLRREQPFLPCDYPGVWLEPVLRCQVQVELVQGEEKPKSIQLLMLLDPEPIKKVPEAANASPSPDAAAPPSEKGESNSVDGAGKATDPADPNAKADAPASPADTATQTEGEGPTK